jgi:hypothetical protein
MTGPMTNPDPLPADDAPDEDLVAYLDGEADEETARDVERRVAVDPHTRTKVHALKKTYDLLDYLPKPDPSPDFATKTVTHLQATPGTTTLSVPTTSPRGVAWPFLAVAAAMAVIVGLAVGFATRPGPPPDEPLTPDLLPVLARLPYYAGVDDLAFLTKLDRPDLFGDDPTDLAPRPAAKLDRSLTSDVQTKLFQQYRALPPERRRAVVALDKQLRELPDAGRDRLGRVLEEYAVWLDRLPEALRKDVLDAKSGDERVTAIETVQIREWQETLPADKRQRLKVTTDPDEKAKLLRQWLEAEKDRKQEWHLAARQWQAVQNGERPWPFNDESLRNEVEEYVKTVLRLDRDKTRLTAAEFLKLELLRRGTERDLGWIQYGAFLLDCAKAHPSLPPPRDGTPVTTFEQLPATIRDDVKRRNEANPNRLKASIGKWPEFALAVQAELRPLKLANAGPLGPCKPGAFTPAVDEFLATSLIPKLTPAQANELKRLEGRWPEHPRKLLELARAHDLSVPGVTLPGPPSLWDRYYRYESPKSEKAASRPGGS